QATASYPIRTSRGQHRSLAVLAFAVHPCELCRETLFEGDPRLEPELFARETAVRCRHACLADGCRVRAHRQLTSQHRPEGRDHLAQLDRPAAADVVDRPRAAA